MHALKCNLLDIVLPKFHLETVLEARTVFSHTISAGGEGESRYNYQGSPHQIDPGPEGRGLYLGAESTSSVY